MNIENEKEKFIEDFPRRKDFYTLKETKELLCASIDNIHELETNGNLVRYKFGNNDKVLFLKSDVKAILSTRFKLFGSLLQFLKENHPDICNTWEEETGIKVSFVTNK